MITKKRKIANAKVDATKAYSLKEASALVKELNCTKSVSYTHLDVYKRQLPQQLPSVKGSKPKTYN